MQKWVLEVCLDGEWESCLFAQREEAKSAFVDLIADYGARLYRASLVSPEGKMVNLHLMPPPVKLPSGTYLH
jgi:hypothetical protein